MKFEEILEVVKVAAAEGIREVRLTGGEPLVRVGVVELVRMVAAVPGIEDISLTTNGLLLGPMAHDLAQAGLKRVNVSLDTLNPDCFKAITRGGTLEKTLDGIRLAGEARLAPIKLNTVLMRGVNDDELETLARLTLEHPWQVRFIEIMPVNNRAGWGEGFPAPEQTYYPISEMLARLEKIGLQPVDKQVGQGPAREYRLPGAMATIGFISPLGDAFCKTCNRLRLTADGNLRPCLLSDVEVPVLAALRRGESPLETIRQAIALKPEGHELEGGRQAYGRCMSQIGG
jgi:cyclic pyranopterin phosphate synthase